MALSLRTISIAGILVGIIFAIFSMLLTEGAENYDVVIDPGTQESWNILNESIEDEYDRIRNQSDLIYEVTGSEILEGAFEGGSYILQIIRAPFKAVELGNKILNEFAAILHVPRIIITGFEAMLLVTVMWFMVYSIRRYREDR